MENRKMKQKQKVIGFLCVIVLLVVSCYKTVPEVCANNFDTTVITSGALEETPTIVTTPASIITSGGVKETTSPIITLKPTQKPVVTKAYFAKKKIYLWPKEKIYNPITILDVGASYKEIRWSVNHKDYATVNKKGKVTLKAKGAGKKIKVTATIYYKEKEIIKSLSASYTLWGKQPVKKITISSEKDYILVGEKYTLSAVCMPKNATNKTIAWSSSDTAYATVSKKGVIRVKKAGVGKSVTFTAKAKDGSKVKKSITFRILDTKKPMIALTFDDGPTIAYTTRILNQLEKYNARATFFVTGTRLQSKEAQKLVARSSKYGNEIASHTFQHKNLTKLSVADIQKESLDTNNLIQKITGKYPMLTRPPYGSVNSLVKSTITTPLILWSIDTRDWQTRNSSMTISKVLGEVGDGDIILMHDVYDATAVATEMLIPQLVEKGYQFVTVSELATLKNVKLTKGNVYYSIKNN